MSLFFVIFFYADFNSWRDDCFCFGYILFGLYLGIFINQMWLKVLKIKFWLVWMWQSHVNEKFLFYFYFLRSNIVLLKKGSIKSARHILDVQKNYKNLENLGEKKKIIITQLSTHKESERIAALGLGYPIWCLQNCAYFVPSINTTWDSEGWLSKSMNADAEPAILAKILIFFCNMKSLLTWHIVAFLR